ncbi:MAG TPA: hypothetical protein VMH61_01200 [Candidatus Acidoferrales bacterium]|nr:hypothetical protein [Candidatus Acidoferrales bacterium]
MSRGATLISLLAMLLIGGALGFLGGEWTQRRHMPIPGPPPIAKVMSRLQHELDLTPAQVERIRPLVIDGRRSFQAARDSLRVHIEAELSPEQREHWHELRMKRARERGITAPDDSGRASRATPGNEGDSR